MSARPILPFDTAPRGREFKLGVAITAAVLGLSAGAAQAQSVVEVSPDTIACAETVTFDAQQGGMLPGTNYDGVLSVSGVTLAERFAGQGLGFNGDFDELLGLPSAPLSLQTGSPGANLNLTDMTGTGDNGLLGMGAAGFPGGFGDGAVAMLFGTDQSSLRFDWLGGNGGMAEVRFYRADGALIDSLTVGGLGNPSTVGFARAEGLADIAGLTVEVEDFSGVGIDNLCYDQVPGLEVGIAAERLAGPSTVLARASEPTAFVFEIRYSGPDALVLDTVPAELEVVSCLASHGDVEIVSRSKKQGRGPTRLEWTVPEGSSQLTCEVETRLKPGKGGKNGGPVYQPSGCGDLALNEGPNAFERDPDTGELVYVEQEDPETGLVIMAPALVAGPGESLSVPVERTDVDCEATSDAFWFEGQSLTGVGNLLGD